MKKKVGNIVIRFQYASIHTSNGLFNNSRAGYKFNAQTCNPLSILAMNLETCYCDLV